MYLLTSVIAQLQVNLRPLWSPAAKAIASLSERFGDKAWSLLFSELEAIIKRETDNVEGSSMDVDDPSSTSPMESERSWRDPSSAKLRQVVKQWLANDPVPMDIYNVGLLAYRLSR